MKMTLSRVRCSAAVYIYIKHPKNSLRNAKPTQPRNPAPLWCSICGMCWHCPDSQRPNPAEYQTQTISSQGSSARHHRTHPEVPCRYSDRLKPVWLPKSFEVEGQSVFKLCELMSTVLPDVLQFVFKKDAAELRWDALCESRILDWSVQRESSSTWRHAWKWVKH